MGILVTTVVMNVGVLEVARLKTDASRLAGAVRYLHNLAVMNNGYYRLVLDLGTGKYSGEEVKPSAKGCAVFVRTDADDEREAKEAAKAAKDPKSAPPSDAPAGAPAEDGGAGGEGGVGGEPGGPTPQLASADASEAKGGDARPKDRLRRKANLLKHLELGKGVRFEGVLTQYRKELQTEGKSTIHFFPDGTIERALIYVANDEETWTVVTEPAMGIARVHHEKREDDVLEIEHD